MKISQACKSKEGMGHNAQSLLWAILVQVLQAFSINPKLFCSQQTCFFSGLPSQPFLYYSQENFLRA